MRRFPTFSIAQRLALLAVIVTASLVALVAVAAYAQRAQAQADRQDTLRAVVQTALGVVAQYGQQERAGELTQEQAQEAARDALRAMRYADNEYIWIHDTSLTMVMHPGAAQLEGTDLSDNVDPDGVFLFREMNEVVTEQGNGFVEYKWPRPGSREALPRIAFVEDYQPWGWVIGAGVYVDDIEADFRSDVTTMLSWGIPLVVLVFLLTVTTALSITRRVAALRRAVTEELPQRILTIGSDDQDLAEMEPLNFRSNDELSDVAVSFNSLFTTALGLAETQSSLRKSTSEMYVNLGRRNHKLLSRTLSYISDLEKNERDPETLRKLFLLDHLVTRMRRHAESLLVLAGSAPIRTWKKPVGIENVMRASLSEVENYDRVDVGPVQQVGITGSVVSDLSHVLAEVIENAISFSPPESRVRLIGRATRHHYTITVVDEGIGMSPEELADANHRIESAAAASDLDTSRMLGLSVVGRLASRHGLSVHLSESPMGGLAVTVTIPPGLCTDLPVDEGPTDDRELPAAPAVETVELPPGPAPVASSNGSTPQPQPPASPREAGVPQQSNAVPDGVPARPPHPQVTGNTTGNTTGKSTASNTTSNPTNTSGSRPTNASGSRPSTPAKPAANTSLHGRHTKRSGQSRASGQSRQGAGLTQRVKGAQLPDTGPDTALSPKDDAPTRTANTVRSALASFSAGQVNAQREASRNERKGQEE